MSARLLLGISTALLLATTVTADDRAVTHSEYLSGYPQPFSAFVQHCEHHYPQPLTATAAAAIQVGHSDPQPLTTAQPCVPGCTPDGCTQGGCGCTRGGACGCGQSCGCGSGEVVVDGCCESSWCDRTKRKLRRRWYQHWQDHKSLQHPSAPPLFHPTWGYHQTCWRRFPPLPPCPVYPDCPPATPGYDHPPTHVLPHAPVPPQPEPPVHSKTTDAAPPTDDSDPQATLTPRGAWKLTVSREDR